MDMRLHYQTINYFSRNHTTADYPLRHLAPAATNRASSTAFWTVAAWRRLLWPRPPTTRGARPAHLPLAPQRAAVPRCRAHAASCTAPTSSLATPRAVVRCQHSTIDVFCRFDICLTRFAPVTRGGGTAIRLQFDVESKENGSRIQV